MLLERREGYVKEESKNLTFAELIFLCHMCVFG